jgi:hypothetical protein
LNLLERYQKLKNDFRTPLRGLLYTYRLLKGPLRLTLRDGTAMEISRDDFPLWQEYFEPRKAQVEVGQGLFKVSPLDKNAKPYRIKGGNYMITHEPERFYPQALESAYFRRLQSAEKKIFSQHGEDGVIQEIFSRVLAPHRFMVEFGAHDGVKMSNSRNLILHHDWKAFLIEADSRYYKKLKNLYASHPRVRTLFSFVTEENINRLFHEAKVPHDFEVLSIDVDSIDYYLWAALTEFRPRLVIVECNPMVPPDQSYVVSKEKAFSLGGTSLEGASFKAFVDLAETKDYALIYTELCGSNLFFLDKKYLKDIDYDGLPAQWMYQPPQFGELAGCPTLNGRGYP